MSYQLLYTTRARNDLHSAVQYPVQHAPVYPCFWIDEIMMYSGNVTFHTVFPGMQFDSVLFLPHHSSVTEATISSSFTEGVRLEVAISLASSVDDAIVTAREVAAHVANVLSFRFRTCFHTFELVEHALVEDKSSDTTIHLGDSVRINENLEAWITLVPCQCQEIKTLLEQPNHSGYQFFELFRSALHMTDPLSKFMGLYSIILSLSNDRQEDVDKLVLSAQPHISTNPPHWPRQSNTPETVYTRLRNQIGHVRPETTIQGTRNEMATHLNGLTELTKEIIQRQP